MHPGAPDAGLQAIGPRGCVSGRSRITHAPWPSQAWKRGAIGKPFRGPPMANHSMLWSPESNGYPTLAFWYVWRRLRRCWPVSMSGSAGSLTLSRRCLHPSRAWLLWPSRRPSASPLPPFRMRRRRPRRNQILNGRNPLGERPPSRRPLPSRTLSRIHEPLRYWSLPLHRWRRCGPPNPSHPLSKRRDRSHRLQSPPESHAGSPCPPEPTWLCDWISP